MPESLSRVSRMRALVALVAGPRGWNDTRQSWLARAARRAGISYRQCKAIWYAEITDKNHRSARLLRDAAEELANRYEEVASGMAKIDADTFGPDRDALIELARTLRDLAGT